VFRNVWFTWRFNSKTAEYQKHILRWIYNHAIEQNLRKLKKQEVLQHQLKFSTLPINKSSWANVCCFTVNQLLEPFNMLLQNKSQMQSDQMILASSRMQISTTVRKTLPIWPKRFDYYQAEQRFHWKTTKQLCSVIPKFSCEKVSVHSVRENMSLANRSGVTNVVPASTRPPAKAM